MPEARGACPNCKHRTRAAYDADAIPASPFGPRLLATIGLLTSVYHLSRRTTQSDLLGLEISLGGISGVEARAADAVEPAVEEAWEQARQSP